uniref:Uncharacterized protein n=1 Tax=Sphaerodactylus townsendi TaxID=933632 RepID=A0ACB8EEL2_9SAUR
MIEASGRSMKSAKHNCPSSPPPKCSNSMNEARGRDEAWDTEWDAITLPWFVQLPPNYLFFFSSRESPKHLSHPGLLRNVPASLKGIPHSQRNSYEDRSDH